MENRVWGATVRAVTIFIRKQEHYGGFSIDTNTSALQFSART